MQIILPIININLTVLLVVRNCENYIKDCVASVLKQSYKKFELLIINDNSTDKTQLIIESVHDERIRLINNKTDYISSLNLGIELLKGKYIARMDGDDIMMPRRLKKQIEVMEKHNDVSVCATWIQEFGLSNQKLASSTGIIKYYAYPQSPYLYVLCKKSDLYSIDVIISRSKIFPPKYLRLNL